MNRKAQRQALVLGGLLIVLALLLWTQFGGAAPTTEPSQPSNRSARIAPGVVGSAAPDVRLERLDRPDGPLTAAARNPFRFRARVASPSPRAGQEVSQPFPPEAPVATGPPAPPPIPLRFIGIVEPRARAPRIAVFASTDGRGDVLYGKEGDIIEGRYRVLRVGPEAAELAYIDGRGRQSIRLSGQ